MAWKILIFTVALSISLLLVEFAFRGYGYYNHIDFSLYSKEIRNPSRLPKGLFIPDSLIEGKLQPQKQFLAITSDFSVLYSINKLGLRDKDYEYIRPLGKRRFLAFGDSFTFGEGIPYGQRFTDILEEKLPNTEFINFGIPGIGLDKIFFVCSLRRYEV